jgi:cell division protein FtsB
VVEPDRATTALDPTSIGSLWPAIIGLPMLALMGGLAYMLPKLKDNKMLTEKQKMALAFMSVIQVLGETIDRLNARNEQLEAEVNRGHRDNDELRKRIRDLESENSQLKALAAAPARAEKAEKSKK